MNVDTKFSSYEALDTLVAKVIKVQGVCITNQMLNICNHIHRNGSNKRLYPDMGRLYTHPYKTEYSAGNHIRICRYVI
jgi:hypothetical protein